MPGAVDPPLSLPLASARWAFVSCWSKIRSLLGKSRLRLAPQIEVEVSEAEDGEQALEQFMSGRPDLVLLDLSMPGMSGYEVLGKMLGIDGGVSVVVVTADT